MGYKPIHIQYVNPPPPPPTARWIIIIIIIRLISNTLEYIFVPSMRNSNYLWAATKTFVFFFFLSFFYFLHRSHVGDFKKLAGGPFFPIVCTYNTCIVLVLYLYMYNMYMRGAPFFFLSSICICSLNRLLLCK